MSILIILFCITVYGFTNILVYGSIFSGLRSFLRNNISVLGDLMSCMMCLSFWVGVGVFLSVLCILTIPLTWGLSPIILLVGGFSSGSTWLIHTIQEYFEK